MGDVQGGDDDGGGGDGDGLERRTASRSPSDH